MSNVFVDTGGWVALFVRNDEHHADAVRIFEEMKRSKASLYTSDYVIDETVTTIRSRGGHAESVRAGDALFASRIVKTVFVGPTHLPAAWELYKKYGDKKFSFTDVTSFVVLKDLGISDVFSFDRDFLQAGFTLLH
jgi:predicted nucleic acid-binding protein